jgi:23S rRNA (cytidine1920-2'-O)/16S rRNA (cytidine1409-2'-O)-methyltransferase
MRADVFLVKKGFAASRAEAAAAIAAGGVTVDGKTIGKSSQLLTDDATVTYARPHPYVSRGGVKLVAALDQFSLSPAGMTALDIGASTGGFTQVLLERGARHVYAVDVGHGQLHASLVADSRVTPLEGVNARNLSAAEIPETFDCIVADVSFISLRLALPPALTLAPSGAWLIALFKPQFEVGRDHIGKGGIVRDATAREAALTDFTRWLSAEQHWTIVGTMPSPIEGGDGNVEYLVAARNERGL